MQYEPNVHLGYPVYFATIIGFWKVLGAIAILAPGFPRLKEWAYAGIFFNMTGAAATGVFTQSAAWHVIVDLVLAALAVASWALRPASRRLDYRMLGSASEADDAVQEACDAERHLRQPHSAQPGGALFRLECAKDNGKTNSLVFSGNIDYLVKF